ncbi:hypothetical protein [Clostridium senegalense]|uniref:hypothetical protein n=1 Tax=Clostridium senegalense TaxID=1465809 RepID=UPI00047527ED|nr:hypothetical protein [Clostridium senegalense]
MRMNIGKGLRKRIFSKVTLLLIVMITLLLVGCNSANVSLSDKKHLKAVFERQNKIYYYDEKKQEIKELGESGTLKELLSVSPNNEKIVYQIKTDDTSNKQPEIVVENLRNGKIEKLPINNEEFKIITDIKWINDERILIKSHINPSVLAYGVYDVNTKKEVNFVKGNSLNTYNDGDKLLYTKEVKDTEGTKSYIYINDKLVYELENADEQIQETVLSEDFSKLAFKTFKFDITTGEVTDTIYLADFDKEYKLSNIKSTTVPQVIVGSLMLDKNQLYLSNHDVTYKVENDLFTETDLKKPELNTEKPKEEQLAKFKEILAKQFPKEFVADYLELEELQIYNIKFF